MSKLRRKFIAVLAVLFCILLCVSTALMIPKNKTAKASSTNNGLNVGNLIKSGTGTNIIIDRSNLTTLYTRLSGSASYSAVESLAAGKLNGQEIRAKASGQTAVTLEDTVGEFTVNFGGMDWIPTYLSKNSDNEVILTLWLAQNSMVYSSNGATSGSGCILYKWNDFTTTNSSVDENKLAGCMYATSKVRSYLVGSKYASTSGLSDPDATGIQNTTWANFINNYGNLIETPETVEWQKTQSSMNAREYRPEASGSGFSPNNMVNESWSVPAVDGWVNADEKIYRNKHYGDWKIDKLWVPSKTETGDNNKWYGFWRLSENQLKNPTYAYFVRSGSTNAEQCVVNLSTGKQDNFSNTKTTTSNSENFTVRPAFHLNLTKLEYLLPAPKDVENTYIGSEQKIADLTEKPDWYSQYTTAYDNISNIKVEYPTDDGDMLNVTDDGYEVKVTIPSGSKYRWADGTDSSVSKSFKFKIKKKQARVQFTPTPNSGTITAPSGDFNSYPTATCVLSDICLKDREGQDNYDTNYPHVRLKYQLSSNEPSYDKPTEPGTYKVTAEIDPTKVTNVNYEIISDSSYPNPITFIIKKVEVTKPSLKYSSFTYNGGEQAVEILDLVADNEEDDKTTVVYTVKKGNTAIITDGKGSSFTVKDAGQDYTITFSIPSDKQATHVWKDTDSYTAFDLNFTVEQAELTINLARGDGLNSWSWNINTEVKVKVTVTGVCGDDDIGLDVSYTNGSSGDTLEKVQEDGYYLVSIPKLVKGKYKLVCTVSNGNYKINSATDGKLEREFEVTAAGASFEESKLVWQYTNDNVTQDFTEGNRVTYNGKEYLVSLKNADGLADMGVKIEGDIIEGATERTNANGVNGAEEVYIVTLKIVALDENYTFEGATVEFKWYIVKATYDDALSAIKELEWSYKARGNEVGSYPADGIQYEGGEKAGKDEGYIEVYVSGGLPAGLTVETIENNGKYEINTYTARITKLKNSDPNYEDVSDLSAYDWATFEWKIIKRTLPTDVWSDAKYENEKVTVAPELDTSPYNLVELTYKFYSDAACSEYIGTEDDLDKLTYVEGMTKTYYVKVFIKESDDYSYNNFYIDPDKNTYEFTVGEVKTAVKISVAAGGTYDGTPKGATITIVGNVPGIDTSAFKVTYYKANSNVGFDDAPTNAGSYRAVIALEAGYTKFYIDSPKSYDFTIATRELTIPENLDNRTYDGEEHDVAELFNLPDGWDKYIDISIRSSISGNINGHMIKSVADYEVYFSIKDGINTGTPNNVQWSDGSKNQKKANVSIVKLVLNAEGWTEKDYDSTMIFKENEGRNFVTYTVTDIDGRPVDRTTVENSKNESFIVTVSVAEEHIGNVEIVFPEGISKQYEFFTNGGVPPVKVKLPTIADLTFNGTSQTFVVDYGEFADYIELDLSQSNVQDLTQFDAGVYKVYFKIKSGVNAAWEGTEDDRKPVAVTFEMKPLILENPKVAENQKFTYTGSEQAAILNIDSAILAQFMIIEGDYKAINADNYTFTLSIDPSFAGNVVWASVGDKKTVNWTIEKAKISVKWTESDVPELDIPEEFKDLDIEYEIRDENGNKVSKDELEPGKKYTITATLSDGSSANYEFVDDSGKTLKNPAKTDGFGFEIKNNSSSFPWWIIAVVAGLLLAAAAVIVVVIKKRQAADGDDYDDYYDDEYDFDDDMEEDYDDFDDDF